MAGAIVALIRTINNQSPGFREAFRESCTHVRLVLGDEPEAETTKAALRGLNLVRKIDELVETKDLKLEQEKTLHYDKSRGSA